MSLNLLNLLAIVIPNVVEPPPPGNQPASITYHSTIPEDTVDVAWQILTDSRPRERPVNIPVPPGFYHITTTAIAVNQESYEKVKEPEVSWWADGDGKPCDEGDAGARLHRQKEITKWNYRVIVFPPHNPKDARD